MIDITISFTIQGDSEGYVIFECPFCEMEFKLQAGEYQNDDIPVSDLYCPYCGLTSDKQEFFSKEVVEQVAVLAQNAMIEELNKSLGKMARGINRSGKGVIKMTFRPLAKQNTKELGTPDTSEEIFCCQQCDHNFKVLYCAGKSKVFCPYCGVDV